MKPASLRIPSRDLGWAEIRPLAGGIIDELERIGGLADSRAGKPARPLAYLRRLLGDLGLRTGDAITLEKQRVLQRAIDEAYFRVPLWPAACYYEGTVTETINNNVGVMRFGNAANAHANRNVETRELWVRTIPRIHVWYTSPTAGTATFTFRFIPWVFGAGVATTAASLVGAGLDWSAPGPAAANDVLYTSATTGVLFPSSPVGVARFRIGRLATTDANANDLDVLLALVVFEEVA